MRKPKRPALNRLSACDAQAGAREKRIVDEIVVDAYTPEIWEGSSCSCLGRKQK
jgi:hypothetical protein